MPAAHIALTRLALAFSAGLFLWSSGAHQPPPAASPKARFESSRRLGDLLRDPRLITASDVKTAQKNLGEDAAQSLETLRRSAR